MASINYYFRLTKEESEALKSKRKVKKPNKKLYVRVRDTNIDIPVSLRIKVDINHWDFKNQILRLSSNNSESFDEINNKLRIFKTLINNELPKSQIRGDTINKEWLNKHIQDFFNKDTSNRDELNPSLYFKDHILNYIVISKDTRRNSKGEKVGKRTIQDYEKTLRLISLYEEWKRIKLKHSDITISFHRDFLKLCREYEVLGENTIGGHIKNIKTFLHDAESNNINVCQDFKRREFYKPSEETTFIVLNIKEIKKIEYLDLSNNPVLNNARDWFIIGLWTGLRVGDLLSLTETKTRENGKKYIEVDTQKTGKPVVIPLHDSVTEILEKREGQFPYKIADATFNEYIKTIGELAGINEEVEGALTLPVLGKNLDGTPKTVNRSVKGKYPKYKLITSHICRRSFATNHYGKIPNLTIMQITGHKTERIFLKYINIKPTEHADALARFWENNK